MFSWFKKIARFIITRVSLFAINTQVNNPMEKEYRSAVKEYLKDFANSPEEPHFAVLIEGEWGCGKTHFCKQLIGDESFTDKPRIYLSLFGLQSLEQFQTQLFFASTSRVGKFAHGAASVFSSILKGTLRLDLDGDNSSDVTVSSSVPNPQKAIQNAATNLDGALLFLDDLERCNIDLNAMLGEINRLVEHGNTRVVLVANKEKIEDQEKLQNLYDKLVGKAFEISSDPTEALRSFVTDTKGEAERSCLESHVDKIVKLHHMSGYSNIRVLRQFVWHLRVILSKLDDDIYERTEVLGDLVQQAFIFFVEFKHNLSDDSSSLTLDDLYSSYDTEKKNVRYVADISISDEEETPKKRVLDKYDAWSGIHTVLTLQQWISILKIGVIDKEWLNAEIRGSSQFAGSSGWPSWKRLWHLQKWDFSDGSHEQFEADLIDMQSGLDAGRYKNPLEFLHVASVMLMMSRHQLITDNEDEVVEKALLYIDSYIVSQLSFEFIDGIRFELSGYDSLGYPRKEDEHFSKIREHFLACCDQWKEKWIAQDAGNELLDTLTKDFWLFSAQISLQNTASDQRFQKIAVLHHIDAQHFLRVWLDLGIEQQGFLPSILVDRYKFEPHLLDKEESWCLELFEQLKEAKENEEIRPRKAQMEMLCETFEDKVIARIEAHQNASSTEE